MKTVIEFMGMISEKYGAIERYNVELANQLNAKGVKTVFVYNKYPENESYIKLLQESNADIIELPINKGFFNKVFSVNIILKKYKPNVVHCHFSFPLIRIIIFLSWLRCVPKRFVSIRSMQGGEGSFISKIWWFGLEKLSTKFLAVSERVKKQLVKSLRISENHIDVLRRGVDFSAFEQIVEDKKSIRKKYQLPVDKLIIGCAAFHQPIKGVDVLLDTLAILKNEYKRNDILLVQVGYYAGEYADFLKKKTKDLDIKNVVYWLGLQDNVPEIMKTFDVYCQPSRSEGLPQSIVEAFASKLPVVATNVGGIPEVVENEKSGFLVEKENSKEMAEKINILLNSSELRAEFGAYGYNMARSQYDRNIQVEKLIEYYLTKQ